ncbi:uncharacterized protein BO87DRAFT_86549 [Aspergillus neoniger CBS 115656]|uniref:Uncharacterized protein n=3 Tax=Aspergillus subgen. Circumdati TaxID=2720871 RepID=A0A1L9MZ49_ASPTC|nr:hypothetical protein BO87DRAFT_86549 [Aspergillus neoniger CBS 115656]XP_025543061.1 hypothetical protein BO79DRAFT_62838 [Aspergillus costaricaensis CBS 115574]OJI82324.1 hypothetical protein ASPTUDRAFT_772649 [Aspergillus tubingensis CBS 134.48]PYH33317.1 hypothetical protein BO87DRAFT_86549 [Aspergillus neoniger CBS 115656]RAK92226.1 hypothetical protein BO79DRAFT_62838 [Aspergillus costaricaensis CBS 115574]
MPEDPVLCKMQYSVHIAKITSESTPPAMLRHARRRSCSTVNKGLSTPRSRKITRDQNGRQRSQEAEKKGKAQQ